MDDTPEMDPLVTSIPTPPPKEHANDHGGSKGKKLAAEGKSGLDRLKIATHGLEIIDAPHHSYVDSGDSKNVRLTRNQIISLGELFGSRGEYLERKAHDEKGDFTELEVIVREIGPKIQKLAKFVEGGPEPSSQDMLSQADLDAAYYLLMDEIEQRGAMLGYEVFLHPTSKGWRPEASQFSASRKGVETPYTKYLAAHGQDRGKIEEDLEKWEGVRVDFEQALTGRGLRDRIFDRANWGISRTSMFRRDRSELRLHTEILHALEESDEPVIRNFIATHGHIQRVTDLLVTLDSPAERNIAIRAYHEAISKASAIRFQLKAAELLEKLHDRSQTVWEEKGWIITAEANLNELEGEGKPTTEQKKELEELRDGLKSVRDILRGKKTESGEIEGGVPVKLEKLRESILDYRTYTADPQHNIATLTVELGAAKAKLESYRNGVLPVPPPADMVELKTDLDEARTELTAAIAAGDVGRTRNARSNLTEMTTAFHKAMDSYRDSFKLEVDRLNGEIQTIKEGISAKEQVIKTQYLFIETEIPDHIITITDLRNRLDKLAHPPAVGMPLVAPPVAAHLANHVGLLDQQRNHLDTILTYLNGMLDGNSVGGGALAMNALRMQVIENIEQYTNRYDFNLDRNLFRTLVALPFEDEIRSYEEILKGVHDEEREDKIKGIQLVQCVVAGGKDGDGTLGKAHARLLTDGQDGRMMTELRNTHSLAIVRDATFNHPEILGAKKKGEGVQESLGIGDTLIWQRVFSDVFILQSYIEWSVRRGGLEIPPPPAVGGAGFDLEVEADPFRQRVIEKMSSNHIEFGRFLDYLVEKRLRDAGEKLEIQGDLRIAEKAIAPPARPGTITYHNRDRIGPAATIFAVEENVAFATRVRTKEHAYYTSSSAEGEIDNIGVVRHSRPLFMHSLDIYSPSLDPLTLDILDAGAAAGVQPRKRNIPLHVQIMSSEGGGRGGRFNISIQADPSLAGLDLNFLGRLDRRWVNLVSLRSYNDFQRYNDYGDLVAQIGNLLPGIPGDEIGHYVLHTLGGYFLELSPTQRLTEFGRFPDAVINPVPERYPGLEALGFQRISLDSSGVVKLFRTVGAATTSISIDSALDGEFDVGAGPRRKLNTAEVEELIRLTGEHVFNIVRR